MSDIRWSLAPLIGEHVDAESGTILNVLEAEATP